MSSVQALSRLAATLSHSTCGGYRLRPSSVKRLRVAALVPAAEGHFPN